MLPMPYTLGCFLKQADRTKFNTNAVASPPLVATTKLASPELATNIPKRITLEYNPVKKGKIGDREDLLKFDTSYWVRLDNGQFFENALRNVREEWKACFVGKNGTNLEKIAAHIGQMIRQDVYIEKDNEDEMTCKFQDVGGIIISPNVELSLYVTKPLSDADRDKVCKALDFAVYDTLKRLEISKRKRKSKRN